MSIRDDKKDLKKAGGPIPADTQDARRVAETEDADTKKTGKPLKDEPGPDFRVASEGESEEEHALTTDSPRWGDAGSSREERGYPREGGEERDIHPRK